MRDISGNYIFNEAALSSRYEIVFSLLVSRKLLTYDDDCSENIAADLSRILLPQGQLFLTVSDAAEFLHNKLAVFRLHIHYVPYCRVDVSVESRRLRCQKFIGYLLMI